MKKLPKLTHSHRFGFYIQMFRSFCSTDGKFLAVLLGFMYVLYVLF